MRRGFTLIELMIVVAIIAIIAAIAIPNLLGSRKAANQSTAIANLRTLATAQETYAAGHGNKYADSFDDLEFLTSTAGTTTVTRAGYDYYLLTNGTGNNCTDWYAYAIAKTSDDGDHNYYVDRGAVVKQGGTPGTKPSDAGSYESDKTKRAAHTWTPIGK